MADSVREKEIVINDRRYLLRKMTPPIASRIHNWLISGSAMLAENTSDEDVRMAESEPPPDISLEARADANVVGIWIMASSKFSEELQERTQMHCLQTVSQFPTQSPDAPAIPVMVQNRLVCPDLESDPVAYNNILLEVLKFNISPFFLASISKSARA